jgi:hypothetical protein
MNVTASKVLLAVSLASYAYCVWDHLFTGGDAAKAAAASKGKELTTAVVNVNIPLKVDHDPFGSVKLDGTFESAVAIGANPNVPREFGEVKLQGIILGPGGRTAMINGVPFHQGESAPLPPGGIVVLARRVAADYVILEARGQTVLLKLEDPKPDQHGGESENRPATTTGTGTTNRNTAAAHGGGTGSAPSSHGGGTGSAPPSHGSSMGSPPIRHK